MKSVVFLNIIVFIFIALVKELPASAQEFKMAAELEQADSQNFNEYKAEDLKDPFQSYAEKEGAPLGKKEEEAEISKEPLPALTVQGVIWGGNLPQAIINNKVVKIGDTQEGVSIVDINKNGVIVFFKGRKYGLSLWPDAASRNKANEDFNKKF